MPRCAIVNTLYLEEKLQLESTFNYIAIIVIYPSVSCTLIMRKLDENMEEIITAVSVKSLAVALFSASSPRMSYVFGLLFWKIEAGIGTFCWPFMPEKPSTRKVRVSVQTLPLPGISITTMYSRSEKISQEWFQVPLIPFREKC